MIIATNESFIGSFTYYLNGYITEPGDELLFSDQKTYNKPILQAKDFNRLRRDSHEAGINAGSGCADKRYSLITQFILYGHPVFTNLTLIPQPLKEQLYTLPEGEPGCQEYRFIRERTYTYQVSGYITDQLSNPSRPQSFTELVTGSPSRIVSSMVNAAKLYRSSYQLTPASNWCLVALV
ncbi:hypothetical protein [Aeromonas media]|uniref:hypothetical protein n=1 Tax=Aeromonas media TaxID=651 RepID=UPI0038D07B6D